MNLLERWLFALWAVLVWAAVLVFVAWVDSWVL